MVGPTIIGPEEFAQAGYDYVGFDIQHGYLDDADVALMLRRLEHVPDRHRGAAAVGGPRAHRAGARRRRRRGHHRDGRIGRAGGRRGGRDPLRAGGVRSFGPLRASLGIDPAALEARTSVFAMIETAPGVSALDEICAVPGLTGRLRRPGGSRDLAGVRPRRSAGPTPTSCDAMARIQTVASAAGLVAGIHAGAGTPGKAMAELGFRMITLASESQALRRGAAEHLEEAQ